MNAQAELKTRTTAFWALALIAGTILAICLVGCASLFQTVITTTSVVDTAMKDWAALSVAGKTSAALDANVKAVHAQYQVACGKVQDALTAYKLTGEQAPYLAALNAARVIASELVDLIVPLVTPNEGSKLKSNLAKAQTI